MLEGFIDRFSKLLRPKQFLSEDGQTNESKYQTNFKKHSALKNKRERERERRSKLILFLSGKYWQTKNVANFSSKQKLTTTKKFVILCIASINEFSDNLMDDYLDDVIHLKILKQSSLCQLNSSQ